MSPESPELTLYLPPSQHPALLRFLTGLFLAFGILGLLSQIVLWATTGDPRWSRIIAGLVSTHAAWELRKGDRGGLTNLIWVHLIGCLGIGYLLVADAPAAPGISPLILGLVAAWVFSVTGYLIHCRRSLPWEYLDDEDEDYYEDYEAEEDSIEIMLAEDRANPPDIAGLITDLLDQDSRDLASLRIEQQGLGVLPEVIAALSDHRFQHDSEGLVYLLNSIPEPAPPVAADSLAHCCLNQDPHVRNAALDRLASTGSSRYAQVLVAGLTNTDSALATASGLAAAFAADRHENSLIQVVEPPLLDLAQPGRGNDREVRITATRALVALDPKHARPLFEDIDFADESRLEMIETCAVKQVELPHGSIDRVVAAAHQETPRQDSAWAWVIRLLPYASDSYAFNRDVRDDLRKYLREDKGHDEHGEMRARMVEYASRDRIRAEAELRWAVELDIQYLSDEAAEYICELHGLPQDPGIDLPTELTTPARYLGSLQWARLHVEVEGFPGLLTELSQPDADALPQALAAIAPPGTREIWGEAIRLLTGGRDHLPGDDDARAALARGLSRQTRGELEKLTGRHHSRSYRLDIALCLYAVENADELRALMEND